MGKVKRLPRVAQVENELDDFNLEKAMMAQVRSIRGKANQVPMYQAYQADNYGERAYVKQLVRYYKRDAKGVEPMQVIQQLLARMLFYDAVEIMWHTVTGPPQAHVDTRKAAHSLTVCRVSYGVLGKFSITGPIAYTGRAPIVEQAKGYRARMEQIVAQVYLGHKLCTVRQAIWALMLVGEEIKDIYQAVKLQAAYKQGVLSVAAANMGDFDD